MERHFFNSFEGRIKNLLGPTILKRPGFSPPGHLNLQVLGHIRQNWAFGGETLLFIRGDIKFPAKSLGAQFGKQKFRAQKGLLISPKLILIRKFPNEECFAPKRCSVSPNSYYESGQPSLRGAPYNKAPPGKSTRPSFSPQGGFFRPPKKTPGGGEQFFCAGGNSPPSEKRPQKPTQKGQTVRQQPAPATKQGGVIPP